VPHPQVLVTHSFYDDAPLALATLVRPRHPRRALVPLPVATVKGAHAPRHSAFLVALHNGVELVLVRSSQVGRSPSLENKLHEQLGRLGDHRPRQAHVLVRSVGCFAVGDHAKGSHYLLQWMRLQLACRINAFLEERLVLNSQIDTPKVGAGDTEPRLKVPVIEAREHTANTEVVSQKGVHTGRKVAAVVATAPRDGATIN